MKRFNKNECEKVRLEEVFKKVISGEWGEENIEDSENTVYIIRTTNFKNDGSIDIKEREVVKRKVEKNKIIDKKLEEKDIIIEKSGGSPNQPVGRVVYFNLKADKEFLCNNFTSILRTKDEIESKYIYYFLQKCYRERKVLKFQNKTTGIINLKLQDYLKSTHVYLPSLDEQKKIVKILDKVFFIIKSQKEELLELEKLGKCLFFEMFGDLIINDKNWFFEPLEKICDVRDGTHDSPGYVSEGFPLITSKNINNGIIDFKNVNYISKMDFEKINKRSKVELGDILMPMIGTIGNPVIINSEREFAIKNVALIKFKNSKANNIFIKNLLLSEYFESIVKIKNRGGTQKFLSLNDIRKISIPIVSLELQNKFAERIKLIEKSKFRYLKMIKRELVS